MTEPDPVRPGLDGPAVELRGVSKQYGTGSGQPVTAAGTVSFTVEPGGLIALTGASGSGKSLTAAAIAGSLPDGISASGSITFAAGSGRGPAALIRQDPATALNPLVPVGSRSPSPCALLD